MKKAYTTLILFFFLLAFSASGQNKINAYEYWFDDNYAGMIGVSITPVALCELNTAIGTSSLSSGLHTIHIRFRDNSNNYSTTISRYFYKVYESGESSNKIAAYEYWFDNNYAGKISASITPVTLYELNTSIGTSSLSSGFHTIHIRFRDKSNNYSTTLSQYFYKFYEGGESTNKISAYEYWFDDNYAEKVYQTVTPVNVLNLSTQIDVLNLSDGFHIFHIRFKDNGNSWSIVNSSFFRKNALSQIADNLISGYRYWFDLADTAIYNVTLAIPTKTYQLNDPVNLLDIKKGSHKMHIQFRDTLGSWSTIITDSVYRYPIVTSNFTSNINSLCDSGFINFTNTSFDADTFIWDFGDGVISNLANPSHFFDSTGIFPVKLIAFDTLNGVKDSIIKNITVTSSPLVNLGNDTAICPSGFTLNAWNPDCTYEWSNSSNDSIIYPLDSGTYSVIVTNQSNCQSKDTIRVLFYAVPVVDLGADTTICPSDLILDAWNSGCDYSWSNLSTDSIIHISDSGAYSVVVTNQWGCKDKDTIRVLFYPVPIVELGSDTTVCPSELTLDAWNLNCTYEWSNLSGDSIIQVNDSGAYSVIVTNQWNCSTKDTIQIMFYPLPSVELGNDTTICLGDSIILNAGAGFDAYDWSTGETTPTIVVKTADTYSVEVTDNNGCSNTNSIVITIDPCAGIGDLNGLYPISVYPNPNNGLYFIKANNKIINNITLEVCDLSGRVLYKTVSLKLNSNEIISIDNSGFESGVYILMVTSDDFRMTEKIVVNY